MLGEQQHVAATRPQRRDLHRDHIDAEVEVFAEAMLLHGRFQIAIRGDDQAHVEGDFLVSADGPYGARLERAQELRLERQGELADLVEEQRAARCLEEETLARRVGIREGPAYVAEELALQQRLGERGAVHHDERTGLAPPAVVERSGDELLARTRLARDQHGGVGVHNPIEQIVEPSHRRAGAEQRPETPGLVDGAPEPLHLVAERAVLDRAPEREREGRHLERLGHEVVGAAPDRRHGGLDAPERGDDDHRHLGLRGDDPPAELEPVHARHVEVGHHGVELSRRERLEGRGRRRSRAHREAELAEVRDEHVTHARIVVDDQHASRHEAASTVPGSAAAR